MTTRIALRERLVSAGHAILTTDQLVRFSVGMWCLLQCQSWLALFGFSPVAQTSGIAALVAVFALRNPLRQKIVGELPAGSFTLLSTGVICLNPMLVKLATVPLGWFPDTAFESVTVQFLAILPGSILLLALPLLLMAGSLAKSAHQNESPAGMSLCGFLFAMLVSIPLLGVFATIWIVAAGFGIATGLRFFKPRQVDVLESSAGSLEASMPPKFVSWLSLGLLFSIWPTVSSITSSWAMTSLWTVLAQAFYFAGGLWTGRRIARSTRLPRFLRNGPSQLWIGGAVVVGLSLVAFHESFVALMIAINGSVSNVFLNQLLRSLILGLFPCWVGLALASLIGRSSPRTPGFVAPVFAASLILGLLLLSQGLPAEFILAAGGGVFAIVQLASLLKKQTEGEDKRLRWKPILAAAGLLVLSTLSAIQDTTLLPAKVLYSGRAAIQYRRGMAWKSLPFLDDGRIESVTRTARGVFVSTRYRGLQSLIRQNGIPLGYVTRDYRLVPQSTVDTLLAVLPIASHPAPESVAFLGWGTGVPISTALEFPIQQIDCFEVNRTLPELTYPTTSASVWSGLNPQQDDRVRLVSAAPELALRGTGPTYDVLISNPHRSEELSAIGAFTAEYYSACATRLNPNGIFCQRYKHDDHGSDAFLEVLVTIKSVFANVMSINMIPGETLVLAGNEAHLDDLERVVERIQNDHVRRVLARCGWDWGNLVSLPAISVSEVDQLVRAAQLRTNTAMTPQMAWTHPVDAMRWGNKWEEKALAFQDAKRRLAELMGDAGKSADVTRRIEEVSAQQYVMGELPDRPWAYRTKLKDMLLTKPRTELVQVKGEKPRNEMHSIDRMRVEYLEALSDAYQQKLPAADAIHQLTQFVEPYDPLVSHFLHHEVAELYARNPSLDPKSEYLHRLVTIHFCDVRDHSVRNVTKSIQLLLDHPAIVENSRDRFDQLHGLIHILHQRWQLRRGVAPTTADEALNDVRESLQAAEKALSELQQLAATEYGTENWNRRSRYLENTLIAPLRTYRGTLLPHHEKARKAESESADETAPDEPLE